MNILYIGNDLTKKTNYNSSMNTLIHYFNNSGLTVFRSSSKQNKVYRLIDMLFAVLIHRNNIRYIIIDTFSTTNFYYALLVSQLARLLKIKYIPILHGGNLINRLKKNAFLSKLIFDHSYKNVAPSNYLKSEFEKYGYIIHFIPNILEFDSYKFKIRSSISPKILWVRAFDKIYNPTLAIEVLFLLKQKFSQAHLTMVGPIKDESYNDVIKLIENYNLKDSVTITGVLKKEAWHKISVKSDILINTTNIDNTPVSLMEAMALGLPVISTNVGGIPFLIENYVDGILVKKNDPAEMVEKIFELINNKTGLQISLNAREKVRSFSPDLVMPKWLKLLQCKH